MSVVGGYEMHLYCDTGGDPYGMNCPNKGFTSPQAEYVGSNERECLALARKAGWKFKEGNTLAY